MPELLGFLIDLGGAAAVFALVWAFTFWRLSGVPTNAPARGRWVARLRHDAFGRRYREALAAGLDWLDARLSPGFEREASAPKTEVARAWSAPLLDLCLLLAVLYPLLSLLVDWVVTGDAGRIGPLVILPPSDDRLVRAATVGGLAALLGVARVARSARSNRLRLLLAVAAGGLWIAAVSVAGEDVVLVASTLGLGVTLAGAVAVTGAVAITVAGALAVAVVAVVGGGCAVEGGSGLRMTLRTTGLFALLATALSAPFAFLAHFAAGPALAAATTLLFAMMGSAGGAFCGAIEAVGEATNRRTRALGAFTIMVFAVVVVAVVVAPRLREAGAVLTLFLCLLPLLNAAADFASTGLTRWWLRQGLRGNLVGHALRDAGAALGILAALGFAFIATIRWVRPQDGTPLLDLATTFADLRTNPGDYYWLYFCFFSTLLPTVLHLSAACFGLFTLASKRLGRPIAELLQAGATDSVKAKDGVVALSLCVSAALLAPFAALYGLLAVAGEPILFALLDLFEWWARLIGAIRPG